MRFDQNPETTLRPEPIPSGGQWLIRDPHFRVRRIISDAPCGIPTDGTFKVITVVAGGCALGWQGEKADDPLRLTAGDTALVPACT